MFTLGASSKTHLFKFRSLVVFIVSFLALTSVIAFSAEIKLAWDPNTESDLAGYKIYYGTFARTGTDPKSCNLCGYTAVVPIGNVATYTISNLVSGQTYYFSVTAFDTFQNESGFSNEVSGAATIPISTQYTLTANIIGSGSVSKNPDKSTYNPGEQVTLTATPGSGYSFGNWSGDASGTTNLVTLTMNGNKTVTANFTQGPPPPTQYGLVVNTVGSGSVVKNPDKSTYNPGEQVTLTATPGSGYSFSSWSGDASETTNPVTLTMNGNKAVTAIFTPAAGNLVVTPNIGLSASGPQGGSFSPSSQNFTIENKGGVALNWSASKTQSWVSLSSSSGNLAPGTSTTVTVSINSNANSLGVGFYSDTITFYNLMNENGTTTRSVTLTVGAVNQGVTVTTDPPGLFVVVDGANYRSPQTFNWVPGSSHSVSVSSPQYGAAGTQYTFGAWSDGGGQSHTLAASSPGTTYMASLKTQYTLTTFASPPEGGQVSPSGLNWFNSGENITINARVNPGFIFNGWSGDLSGLSSSVSILMNGPKIVTANYSSNPCSLTVSANPLGTGTVTKEPDKPTYGYGEQVTLTAGGSEGYTFKNWSGDVTGEANPMVIAVKGNMTATANFGPSGSIEVNPSEGFSVSGRQGGSFEPSSETYTLRNRSGIPIKWKVSKKPRWVAVSLASGSLIPGETTQLTVSIAGNVKQLKPNFYNDSIVFSNTEKASDSQSRSISLAIAPPKKTYTVKTNPEGLQVIVDGLTYTSPQTFEWEVGSSHTIDTSSPQIGSPGVQYVYNYWSNRKSQSQTLVAPSWGVTYTATFKTQCSLTSSVGPSDSGTITPPGLTWLNQGQRISVTAKANDGFQFMNWSGDISGSSNPINLAVDRPMNLVANFSKIESKGDNDSSKSKNPSDTHLPIIGALESPSEGKRVLGLKTIYGWALDGEGISKVRLLIDGEYICDIPYGGLREELKEIYPNYPGAEKGGYALVWNYSSLPPGAHRVQVEIQNVRGEILGLGASIIIPKLSGEVITGISPKEWLIPGANLIGDGNTKTYDLRVEWSNESEAFEITDGYPH